MKLNNIRLLLFLTVLGLSLNLFAVRLYASDLIGYRHTGVSFGEKLPNGAQDLGGGLMSDENYGVTRFKKDGVFMLWFEKIVGRNNAGVPRWQVLDVLSFKDLKKNQEFLFSYSSPCRLNGKENLDLIVLAETAPRTKKLVPLKAWQANIKTGKFKQIPTTGISCR